MKKLDALLQVIRANVSLAKKVSALCSVLHNKITFFQTKPTMSPDNAHPTQTTGNSVVSRSEKCLFSAERGTRTIVQSRAPQQPALLHLRERVDTVRASRPQDVMNVARELAQCETAEQLEMYDSGKMIRPRCVILEESLKTRKAQRSIHVRKVRDHRRTYGIAVVEIVENLETACIEKVPNGANQVALACGSDDVSDPKSHFGKQLKALSCMLVRQSTSAASLQLKIDSCMADHIVKAVCDLQAGGSDVWFVVDFDRLSCQWVRLVNNSTAASAATAATEKTVSVQEMSGCLPLVAECSDDEKSRESTRASETDSDSENEYDHALYEDVFDAETAAALRSMDRFIARGKDRAARAAAKKAEQEKAARGKWFWWLPSW